MANAWKAAEGKRAAYPPPHRGSYRVSSYRPTGQHGGKREKPTSRRSQRRTWQILISAMVLVVVIGVKLIAPDVMDRYRGKLLELMGENTDFVETFSTIGEAIGDGGVSGALGEAYQEVFGSSEAIVSEDDDAEKETEAGQADREETDSEKKSEKKQVVYSAENLPEDVCMTQQILGFAYAAPLKGELTSRFGYRKDPDSGKEKFHYGIDLAADKGTVISSFAAGLVTAVGESSELGKYVMVAHDGGYTTLYAHCSRITASSGQTVKCGDPIAEVGKTGNATGTHLHFEVHQNTTYLNPIYYIYE